MPPSTGPRLGPYEILTPIGAGGVGFEKHAAIAVLGNSWRRANIGFRSSWTYVTLARLEDSIIRLPHVSLRIPASVALRVHGKWSRGFGAEAGV